MSLKDSNGPEVKIDGSIKKGDKSAFQENHRLAIKDKLCFHAQLDTTGRKNGAPSLT
jgi:hypothetical protein